MWNPLSAIKSVASVVETISTNRTKAKLRKGELLDSKDERNHSWEIAALSGEGWEEPIIRLAIYIEVLYLVIIAIQDPAYATEVYIAINPKFDADGVQIGGIPAFVIGLHLTIAGWGFASQPIKAVGAGLVGSVLNFPKRGKKDGN